jgi:hypothetical protein
MSFSCLHPIATTCNNSFPQWLRLSRSCSIKHSIHDPLPTDATFGTESDTYMNRVWCDIWFIRGALVKAYSSTSPSKYTHTEQLSVSMYGEAGRQAEFLHDRDPRPSQLDSCPSNAHALCTYCTSMISYQWVLLLTSCLLLCGFDKKSSPS